MIKPYFGTIPVSASERIRTSGFYWVRLANSSGGWAPGEFLAPNPRPIDHPWIMLGTRFEESEIEAGPELVPPGY